MPSYHLALKLVRRSEGRSATSAAAFRAACAIHCEREGKTHTYKRRQGVVDAFIVVPEGAPPWALDRSALWNAAEMRETRRNSVTAREWELGLPAELSDEDRRQLAHNFAQALVARYRVAADVAIHAPDPAGDPRNRQAHVLTTTRALETSGLTGKTRALDAKGISRVELLAVRELWAVLQNAALARAGHAERVDHRSLKMQREAALVESDTGAAEALDRLSEVKLGPAASGAERKARGVAERGGREYVPVTERGEVTHAVRELRAALADLREEAQRREA